MKNAPAILEKIISALPASHRKLAREILEARYLARKTPIETAEFLGVSYKTVVLILKEIRDVTRGKTPADFA